MSRKVITTYGLFIIMLILSVLFCMAPGDISCPNCLIKRKVVDDGRNGWGDVGELINKVSIIEVDVDQR